MTTVELADTTKERFIDDKELSDRARSGDAEAFCRLYDRHHHRVRALVISMTGHAVVDDLVQDCFLNAYRSLPKFRGEAAFSTWLHRITVNTVISALRKPRRLMLSPSPVEAVDPECRNPEQLTAGKELVRRLYELLDVMSPKRRVALTLFAIEGLPLSTVADMTGAPVSVVKSRIFFARRELKQKAGADPILGPLLEEMSI